MDHCKVTPKRVKRAYIVLSIGKGQVIPRKVHYRRRCGHDTIQGVRGVEEIQGLIVGAEIRQKSRIKRWRFRPCLLLTGD